MVLWPPEFQLIWGRILRSFFYNKGDRQLSLGISFRFCHVEVKIIKGFGNKIISGKLPHMLKLQKLQTTHSLINYKKKVSYVGTTG